MLFQNALRASWQGDGEFEWGLPGPWGQDVGQVEQIRIASSVKGYPEAGEPNQGLVVAIRSTAESCARFFDSAQKVHGGPCQRMDVSIVAQTAQVSESRLVVQAGETPVSDSWMERQSGCSKASVRAA
jgi:hypothetical protein